MSASLPYEPHYVGRRWVALLTAVHVSVWISWGVLMRVLGFGLPWHLVLVSQYVCETLSLLTHWLGHRPEAGWWFQAHTVGHHIQVCVRALVCACVFVVDSRCQRPLTGLSTGLSVVEVSH